MLGNIQCIIGNFWNILMRLLLINIFQVNKMKMLSGTVCLIGNHRRWCRCFVLSSTVGSNVGLNYSWGWFIHYAVKALNCGTFSGTFSILLLHEPHHSLVTFHIELWFILSLNRVSLIDIFDVMSIIGNIPHSVIQCHKHRLVKQIIPGATHFHTFGVHCFNPGATHYSHFNFLSISDFKLVLVINNLYSVW